MRQMMDVRCYRKQQCRGFTLIEIMVVVVILGILAAVVVPKIMSRPDEARIIRAKQDIRAMGAALSLYRLDNFSYPTTEQGLEALVKRPGDLAKGANWKAGGYLERLPADPWGNPYQYLHPGTRSEFDLYSLGADGVLGGEGVATDIGNWDLE
ncbi:MAG: type II secretion system major pseudopilin GspG [Gammaproteobacteria bacterium]